MLEICGEFMVDDMNEEFTAHRDGRRAVQREQMKTGDRRHLRITNLQNVHGNAEKEF
jgi:hypothetical protein